MKYSEELNKENNMRMKDNIVHPKDVEVQAAPVVFEQEDNKEAQAAQQEVHQIKDPSKDEAEKAIAANKVEGVTVAGAVPQPPQKKTAEKPKPAATVAGAVPEVKKDK